MQSFPSLTYTVRKIHVSQSEVILPLMHIYTDIISLDFSVSCHLPFVTEHSTIRREK